MCGIAGIYNFEQTQAVDADLLVQINQSMNRRGPDYSGFWYSDNHQIGLAHNRLSFVDLHPRSNQPMQYLNGRYVITYNGEIYNYKELRQKLINKGYEFQTTSDTEVITAMYSCYGSAMLTMLRGMFAFVIWDNDEHKLFAARDFFGIKPFYYYHDKNRFVFASQVKAISQRRGFKLTACAAGWCGFIRHGSVPQPYTIFNEIRALPSGHYLEISQGSGLKLKPYFSIYDEFASIENSSGLGVDFAEIDQALSASVEHHLVADVPVGLFLSSGIDSTVLASYLAEQQDKPVAFTLDFSEFDPGRNESRLASQTAAAYQLDHKVIEIELDDAALILDKFFASMDQPSIDGLNVWLISQAVAAAGYRAVLSGLGADEVLAGYPSFSDVPKYSKLLQIVNKISKTGIPLEQITELNLLKKLTHPKLRGFTYFSQAPFLSAYYLKRNLFLEHEFGLFFDSEFLQAGQQKLNEDDAELAGNLAQIENSYLKVSALEIDNYMKNQLLNDADWASMYHSLELRVPFVDWPLIKACATQLVKLTKPTKRNVIAKTLNGRLPEQILHREKTGFETPAEKWLNDIPALQGWKSKPEFTQPNYPWARRWAYEVKQRFA